MSEYTKAEFTGSCGEGGVEGKPCHVESYEGLQPFQYVSINNSSDLHSCIQGNNGACVWGIRLTGNPGYYDFVLEVDAQGPKGWRSGSMYLAFTDEDNDTYYLSIYSSTRSVHTVKYNSERPGIKKIWWSDYSFHV